MNKRKPLAATPLLALIRRNIHLLSCRKHNHGVISSSFPGERYDYKENESCDSNIDNEYDKLTMVKLSLTKSLSDSSGSVVLEEEEQEHSIAHSSHEQSSYVLHMPDPYDLEIETRDDEYTEEKIEDQWEWSMSGMSTIERDWKDINSSSDFHNKTTIEKLVKPSQEQSVHNLKKRANRSGLMIQREQSVLLRHHTVPATPTLPKPFLIRNENSGYTDELSSERDSHDENYDATADDDISIISPLTFTTAYTSASASTNASILDLKMKKRLLEQKIERRLQRARCSTTLPSSVEFVGHLQFPTDGKETIGLPYSSMEVLFP